MGRTITAATKTESLKSSGAKIISLVKMSFDSGTVRFWNGRGDKDFGGETYTGFGDLGTISLVSESVEQRPSSATIELSGIPGTVDMVAKAESENVLGREISIWLGFLDDNYVLIADPILVFRGLMDTMPIQIDKTLTVGVTAENRLVDWDRARIRRFTNADHQLRYPADDGFEFVSDSIEREVIWGGVPAGGVGGGPIASSRGGNLEKARDEAGLNTMGDTAV